ncbi:hypothetical protein A2U01_0043798, partial [Trifolium medium]|nr:hypothetical protein [Trifolium medium]MCI22622.1 hypothetical protein [Trifolium medium]
MVMVVGDKDNGEQRLRDAGREGDV